MITNQSLELKCTIGVILHIGRSLDSKQMKTNVQEIKDYLECPYKFYIFNRSEEKNNVARFNLKAQFELAVKSATFSYFNALKNGQRLSEEDLRKMFANEWYHYTDAASMIFREENINDKKRKLEIKGVQALSNFYREMKGKEQVPLFVNQPFTYKLGEHQIQGKFDLIRNVNDPKLGSIVQLVVIDPGSLNGNIFGVTHDFDMNIQTMAYRQMFDAHEHEAIIYFMEDNKFVYCKRRANEIIRQEKALRSVISAMDQALYYPCYSPFCKTCPVQKTCDKIY